MTRKKTPWYTVYCAGTDELWALGKHCVLTEILHPHHTNMCTKIHKSTVIIMFNKTIKINHKTCLENTMYMLHMWQKKHDTTLNVVQRFKELDLLLLFFLLKIKKLWSSNGEKSIRIQIYHYNYCFSQYTLYNTLPVGVSLVRAISKGHRL